MNEPLSGIVPPFQRFRRLRQTPALRRLVQDTPLPSLAIVALPRAAAGADTVAPSDMMDGRIAAIRAAFDGHGFVETPIMAYAAKFASAFYGPFREAAHSAPSHGDRRSHQMD